MPQILVLAKDVREANQYAKFIGLQRFTYRPVVSAGQIRGVRNAQVHVLGSFRQRPNRHSILGALRYAKTLEVIEVDFEKMKAEAAEPIFADMTDDLLDEAYQINDLGYPDEAELDAAYYFNENVFPHLEPKGFEPGDDLIETLAASTAEPVGHDWNVHVVPDDVEPPKSHTDLVERVTPAAEPSVPFSFDDEPKVLPAPAAVEGVADVDPNAGAVGDPEAEPVPVVKKRRSRCKDCEQLHFADEACPVRVTKQASVDPASFFGA